MKLSFIYFKSITRLKENSDVTKNIIKISSVRYFRILNKIRVELIISLKTTNFLSNS